MSAPAGPPDPRSWSVLHSIEAMPGTGRYAVTFRRADGAEQSAVAEVVNSSVRVAAASLPTDWAIGSPRWETAAGAVLALDAAREHAGPAVMLRDLDGGWDVGLGNVVLGEDGAPLCTAHGPMTADGDVWTCPDCDARAALR